MQHLLCPESLHFPVLLQKKGIGHFKPAWVTKITPAGKSRFLRKFGFHFLD